MTEPKKVAATKQPEKIIRTRRSPHGIPDSDTYRDKSIKILEELDYENFGPTSFFVKPTGEPTGDGESQEFEILVEKLAGLTFDKVPGRQLQKSKKLRVMKAIKPDGTLIQLPMEDQINNAVAGRPGDQIGLLTYTDKGYLLMQDAEKYPYYCYAVDCWAAAMRTSMVKKYPGHEVAIGTGFCSMMHIDHTMPNRGGGMFGEGATTSRVYNG